MRHQVRFFSCFSPAISFIDCTPLQAKHTANFLAAVDAANLYGRAIIKAEEASRDSLQAHKKKEGDFNTTFRQVPYNTDYAAAYNRLKLF